RTVRRDAALPAVDRCAAYAASPRTARSQRAGNEPASRSAARARALDRARCRALADSRRVARLTPDRGARGTSRLPFDRARKNARRDSAHGSRRRAALAVACPLAHAQCARGWTRLAAADALVFGDHLSTE